MLREDVAHYLNLDVEEFGRMEESIASVLGLNRDSRGNPVYEREHLKLLESVFGQLQEETPPAGSLPLTEKPFEWTHQKETPSEKKNPPQKISIPKEEREIRPFIESVPLIHKNKEPEAVSPETMRRMLEEQREYFESRIANREQETVAILRAENLKLKKELLAAKKELELIQNVVRNQNRDREYLVNKLNEKFSLKSLWQWKNQPAE